MKLMDLTLNGMVMMDPMGFVGARTSHRKDAEVLNHNKSCISVDH